MLETLVYDPCYEVSCSHPSYCAVKENIAQCGTICDHYSCHGGECKMDENTLEMTCACDYGFRGEFCNEGKSLQILEISPFSMSSMIIVTISYEYRYFLDLLVKNLLVKLRTSYDLLLINVVFNSENTLEGNSD